MRIDCKLLPNKKKLSWSIDNSVKIVICGSPQNAIIFSYNLQVARVDGFNKTNEKGTANSR